MDRARVFYPLREEPCCILTSVEMIVVIRSATFGGGVSKSTPNGFCPAFTDT